MHYILFARTFATEDTNTTLQLQIDLENAKNTGLLLVGRAKGIHGASMSPSVLAKQMKPKMVDVWFLSYGGKFNRVTTKIETKNVNGKDKEVRTFESGMANLSHAFTQTQVSEDDVQNAWLPSFQRVIEVAKDKKIHWFDGHATKWLLRPSEERGNATAPDGIAQARAVNGTPDASVVIGVHDNKLSRDGKFTDDDRGKLFQYCLVLLEFHQPSRVFIGASLFDGKFAQCFKICRDGVQYTSEECRVLDLSVAADARLYAGFMTSSRAMGWNLSDLAPCAGKCIGRGGTSVVFEHKNNSNCVVKVPLMEQSQLLTHERSMLNRIGRISDRLVHVVPPESDNESWLVLTPRFSRIELSAPFDITLFCSLIDAADSPLRALHSAGFHHCDLRPDNFMMASCGKKLAIVDVGAARAVNAQGVFEHGTVSFASDRVIDAWEHNDQQFVFSPADDLVSLVRCVMVFDTMIETYQTRIHNLGRDANAIRAFWQKIKNAYGWSGAMLTAALDCQYDVLCDIIRRRYAAPPSPASTTATQSSSPSTTSTTAAARSLLLACGAE
jgi:lipoate-protein ligase A